MPVAVLTAPVFTSGSISIFNVLSRYSQAFCLQFGAACENSPGTGGQEPEDKRLRAAEAAVAGADAGERPCGLRDLLGFSTEALAGSKLVYVQQETEIHNIGLKRH